MKADEVYIKLGQNIKKYRSHKGLSQEKLAEMIGVNDKFIGHVERCEKRIGLKSLIEIADALEIKMEDLFRFD